ncbi:DNA primase [Bacillus pseudomycoides]|nr:DNA primase [Bacillus pseudomycoides]
MFIEFKAGEKFAQKGADTSIFHEAFTDCGYLLNENDLVIDIDNLPKETIKAMIKTFNINTQTVWTTRGAHFYFQKPKAYKGKSEAVCPIGFKVEYKTIKNTPNGITIKRDGQLRDIDNMGSRQELPDFLYNGKHNLEDLNGLDEGDGRDNKLYKHKFSIMNVKNYRKALRFINDHIFAEPFNEDDFQRISREEEIQAEDNKEPEVARILSNRLKVVKYNDQLYSYNGERYVSEEFDQEVYELLPDKKTHYVEEVIRQMEKRTRKTVQPVKGFDIRLKNGILRDGRFIEIDSDEFTPFYVNVEYNAEAEPVQTVIEYLDHLSDGDEGYKKLILQMMAHTLITNAEVKRKIAKFFFLIGDGGNGKGTLLEVIRTILGSENCAGNSIEEIADERYFVGLKNRLVNLGDDVEDKPIDTKQMKRLKNISTCDYVATRELFKNSKDSILTTSMIFTSNHQLKSFEKGESYKRRVVWMPMFKAPTKKDPRFISKLTSPEALEYWLKLIIEQYEALYINAEVNIPGVVDQYNAEYHADNNNVLEFIGDYTTDHFIGKKPPQIQEQYEIWATDNGLTVHSKKMLKDTIEQKFGLCVKSVKVNGKTAKAYAKR